ncbi:MAG: DUF3332 family protein [Myxococcota bacterium]
MRRSLGALLIGVFLPISTVGCFGKFQLTRTVYDWNQRFDENKWIRWFAFLGLAIFPYPTSLLIDMLFANTVEFWTGENPITAAGVPRVFQGENGEVATFVMREDGSLDITVVGADGPPTSFVLVREPQALSAWDADGRLLGRVSDVNGEPTMIAGVFAH